MSAPSLTPSSLTLSYTETAQLLGISLRQFSRLVASGRIDHLRAPIARKFSRAKVEAFVNDPQPRDFRAPSKLRRVRAVPFTAIAPKPAPPASPGSWWTKSSPDGFTETAQQHATRMAKEGRVSYGVLLADEMHEIRARGRR